MNCFVAAQLNCTVCQKNFNSGIQYQQHMQSKKHLNNINKNDATSGERKTSTPTDATDSQE